MTGRERNAPDMTGTAEERVETPHLTELVRRMQLGTAIVSVDVDEDGAATVVWQEIEDAGSNLLLVHLDEVLATRDSSKPLRITDQGLRGPDTRREPDPWVERDLVRVLPLLTDARCQLAPRSTATPTTPPRPAGTGGRRGPGQGPGTVVTRTYVRLMPQVTGQVSPVEGLLVDWSVAQPLADRRLPVALLNRAQKAAELQRVQARRAMDAAYEAELVLGRPTTPPTPSIRHPVIRGRSGSRGRRTPSCPG